MVWKVFVVSHGPVYQDYFGADPGLRLENFPILDVSAPPASYPDHHDVVRMAHLPNFRPLGKNWAESEAIYNVWRSGLHQSLEFVGFTQYDKPLHVGPTWPVTTAPNQSLTQSIDALTRDGAKKSIHLSLETHGILGDYRQRILADFEVTDRLTGKGKNCYHKILEDYNQYFGTSLTIWHVLAKRRINLCSSFVVDTRTFETMMRFWEFVLDHSHLDRLDPERKWRLQGGLAERYFGVFLALHGPGIIDLTTPHLKPQIG